MRNVLYKDCRENQNTHFIFNNLFSKNRTIYEIMSKNVVETEGPQMMSQDGAYVLHVGLVRLHVRMHTYMCLGTHAHAQACH
jgi:hypothetical protein